MTRIMIEVPEETADEIREWIKTHHIMLISSTVPRLKCWDILSEDIRIDE